MQFSPIEVKDTDGMLKLHVRTRHSADNNMTVSLVLVNHHKDAPDLAPAYSAAFFQVGFVVKEESNKPIFFPIDREGGTSHDDEMAVLDMLYREKRSFALGHGCGASWTVNPKNKSTATEVCSEFLPKYDLKPVGPREEAFSHSNLNLSMHDLSDP